MHRRHLLRYVNKFRHILKGFGLFVIAEIQRWLIYMCSCGVQAPPALYQGAVAAGAAKAKADWGKIFKLGVVSGAHIGFGAYLAITVGGACPGIAAENPGLQKVSSILFTLKKIKF